MNEHREQALAKWRSLVAEQEQSGQSVAAFCQTRELVQSHLIYWNEDGSWVEQRSGSMAGCSEQGKEAGLFLPSGHRLLTTVDEMIDRWSAGTLMFLSVS